MISPKTDFESHGRATDNAEDDERRPEQIRSEIRRTRAEMEHTVQAISQRLSAEEISRRAAIAIREKASSTGHRVISTIKRNPVPFGLAGLALGLLFWRRAYKAKRRRELFRMAHRYGRRNTDHMFSGTLPGFEYDNDQDSGRQGARSGWRILRKRKTTMATPYESGSCPPSSSGSFESHAETSGAGHSSGGRLGDVAGRARESVRNIGSKVSQGVHNVSDYARDTATQISSKVQYGTQRARQWTSDTYDDYPLAVGVAVFAVGLTCGLLIPSSRKEQELLGPAASKVMNQARQAGSQLIEKGKDVAQRAVEAVKESASETESSSTGHGMA